MLTEIVIFVHLKIISWMPLQLRVQLSPTFAGGTTPQGKSELDHQSDERRNFETSLPMLAE